MTILSKVIKLYIFADSEKQTVRLRDIFDSLSDTNVSPDSENLSVAELSGEGQDATVGALPFTPVNRTLHEGFVIVRESMFLYRSSDFRPFP